MSKWRSTDITNFLVVHQRAHILPFPTFPRTLRRIPSRSEDACTKRGREQRHQNDGFGSSYPRAWSTHISGAGGWRREGLVVRDQATSLNVNSIIDPERFAISDMLLFSFQTSRSRSRFHSLRMSPDAVRCCEITGIDTSPALFGR